MDFRFPEEEDMWVKILMRVYEVDKIYGGTHCILGRGYDENFFLKD